MKKLNYILFWVACMALSLLTGCIKEESYTQSELSMNVTVTRSGSTSDQQGDQIEEIMVWAFQKTSSTEVSNQAAGWRRQTYSDNTYTSVSVHLELPMCGDAGADYVLVAVINPHKFGKVMYNNSELTLDGKTKFTELINAKFENTASETPILNSVEEDRPGSPAVMPISHWTTISVSKDDIHKASGHKTVNMAVFRAVAKTQFMIARTSEFDLKVTSLKLHNKKMPINGMLLSQLSQPQLESKDIAPSWFGNNAPVTTQQSHDFKIATDGVSVSKTLAADSDDVADYTQVAGCTIAETLDAVTYSDNAKDVPADATDGGYYYEITYQIGNATPQTRYVALPAIARNHDYQVRALVNGEGGLEINYTVADWVDVTWDDMHFTPANNTNLLAAPNVNSVANKRPTLTYNATGGTPFKGYFRMSGPIGAKWQPTLYDAASNDYKVEVYEVTDPNSNPIKLGAEDLTGVNNDKFIEVTEENKDKFYEVRIIAQNSERNGMTFKLAISHHSPWHPDDNKLLLINAKSGSTSTYWPNSGTHHTYIEILQN